MNILKVLTEKRRVGNLGEAAAAKYLKRHGYKILERNYVAFGNEVDIIARSKDTISFVEVKTRTLTKNGENLKRPASAVTLEKQKKIIKCAKCYIGSLRYNSKLRNFKIRLDVIEVYLERTDNGTKLQNIIHMEGAFIQ